MLRLVPLLFLLAACTHYPPEKDMSDSQRWADVMGRSNNCDVGNAPEFTNIRAINDYVNGHKQVSDTRNWLQWEYWSTPLEFFEHGGDCEDTAIAKYCLIKRAGLAQEVDMARAWDKWREGYHMMLIVDGMVLDNQSGRIAQRNSEEIETRYDFIRKEN